MSENDFRDELVLQIIEKYGRQSVSDIQHHVQIVVFSMVVCSRHPRDDVNIASSMEGDLNSLSAFAGEVSKA